MKVNKKYYLFIAMMYMFALQFWIMKRITVFQYLDEIYVLVAIPLAVFDTRGKIKIKKENMYINRMIVGLMIFVLGGLLSNIVFNYQSWHAVAQDVFINLKFF